MREIVAMPIDKKPFGHMDAGEIIREYNAALEKRKQIDILADLNCCTRKEMADGLMTRAVKWMAGIWDAVRRSKKCLPMPEMSELARILERNP